MTRKILVADDERLVREPIAAALELAGYEVTLAKNGAEALAAISSRLPDLVLLDLEMPGIDGLGVLAKVNESNHGHKPAFIMLTASQERKAVVAARGHGVRHFLIKSAFSLEELLRRIKQVLEESTSSKAMIGGSTPASASGNRSQNVPEVSPASFVPATAVECPSDGHENQAPGAGESEGLSQEEVAERLRSLKPIMSRDELMKRVMEGSDLRALAPAVKQVLTLTASDSASIDSIAKAIKQDQALSLKILKVANSPLYAHTERVDSVPKAVARIGVAQVRTTVLSLSIVDRFAGVSLPGKLRAEWFWEHSLACGLIAARIARLRGGTPAQTDAMFTAGLLHDVGRMIFVDRLGPEYGHVLDMAQQLEVPVETVESKLLLINHADLTDRLLRHWHFAPELINPIALHHLSVGNIRRSAPQMVQEVATLALANRLAHALVLGCSGNDALYPISEFVDTLEIAPRDITALCAEIPEQTDDLKLTMMSYGAAGGSALLDRSQALGPDVRPFMVARREETSAATVLLRRLRPPGENQTPNVLILRVNQASDRAAMLGMLQSTEAKLGLVDAPVLVLGTGHGCLFKPESFGARRIEQLTLPLRQGRLIRALNGLLEQPGVAKAA